MAKHTRPGRGTRVRNGTAQKRCSAPDHRGSRWLPRTAFQADATRPDGLKYLCRECVNRRQRAYEARPDILERKRAEYAADPAPQLAADKHRRDERVAKHTVRAGEAIDAAERYARRHVTEVAAGRWPPHMSVEVDEAIESDAEVAEQEDREARRAADRAAKIAEAALRREAERAARLASDTDPLRPEDFDEPDDTSVANDPGSNRLSSQFSREKRQEYARAMGQHAHHVRAAAAAELRGDGDLVDSMPPEAGSYIGKLAEQEARFGRRRLARSLSLFAAGEEQARRLWAQACRQYLTGRVVPTGYAAKGPSSRPVKRSVCLLLSDLHIGADLKQGDNPLPYRALEEARRLEYVLRQAIDYKPQYRADSELVLMLNGDLIEGLLLHDFRDGAPLIEQKVAFQRYMERFVGECARAYPRVRIYCQPGNHGRDKVRHPGRATSSKFDSHETGMYYALSRACTALKNVTWDIPFRAATLVDLHGSKLLLTHGDTEVKLGDPDHKATENAQILAEINASNLYGAQIAALAAGHFHKPRYLPKKIRQIFNGALVPPNGHARGAGYIGESCGQWLWESVPGHPVGDTRFIEVGSMQDTDERLGGIIEAFRFNLDTDEGFPT